MDYSRILNTPNSFKIGFVCTGNICRSPMAEVYFRSLVAQAGAENQITVLSAGTGDWHVGEPADHRSIATLERQKLDGRKHRAKQFDTEWFELLDLVIAFDRGQERILKEWAGETNRHKVRLLLSFNPASEIPQDVPDPYYSEDSFFDEVFEMIKNACSSLFDQLQPILIQDKR